MSGLVRFWDREPWWSIGFLLFGALESLVFWAGVLIGFGISGLVLVALLYGLSLTV